MTKQRAIVSYFLILFYIAVPLILLFLPSDFFDSGESICLSIVLFGIECYGCGMTSAMMHLIHGEFELAFAYNILSFLAFPILAFLWLKSFLKEVGRLKKYHQNQRKVVS